MVLPRGAHSLTATWVGPESNGGSKVSGYTIEWSLDTEFSQGFASVDFFVSEENDCMIGACEQVIDGLEKGVPYFVRMYAFNKYGYSKTFRSSKPLSQTPSTNPGRPESVRVQSVSSTSLRVDFQPPSDDGGKVIEHYVIEWDTIGKENLDQIENTALSIMYTTFEEQSITEGQAYFFRVAAQNNQGQGEFSRPGIAVVPSPRKPSSPQKVRMWTLSDTSFNISWLPPATDGGLDITGYQVEWVKTGMNSTKYTTKHVVATTTDIEGGFLDQKTPYFVRVAAINEIGVSEP
ncbi:unnamed protein product, partial [Heterosigma akashiwo]